MYCRPAGLKLEGQSVDLVLEVSDLVTTFKIKEVQVLVYNFVNSFHDSLFKIIFFTQRTISCYLQGFIIDYQQYFKL